MRIYMAAFYQSRGGNRGQSTSTPNLRVRLENAAEGYNFLESYHYMQDSLTEQALRDSKSSVFLDSGAYTAFTQGEVIDLQAYARYIKQHKNIIHVASNLDAIKKKDEKLNVELTTYQNQKEIEAIVDGDMYIGPVFHARDDIKWLKKYLDEGYDYIFLGGMVPENTGYLLTWLDHVWKNYLINRDGTPKIKVHGFGLTSFILMYRYPWYSVDSTSWVMCSRFGGIYIDTPDHPKRKDWKVHFSTDSPMRRDIDSWHFGTMNKTNQKTILERLEQLEAERLKSPQLEEELQVELGYKQGYNVEALSKMYGWRDHFNINYFKRAEALHNVTHFENAQQDLGFM